jgi:hypothetical protein
MLWTNGRSFVVFAFLEKMFNGAILMWAFSDDEGQATEFCLRQF